MSAHYVDIRVPTSQVELLGIRGHLFRLPSLLQINVHPPASGPELELTFGPFEDAAAEPALTQRLTYRYGISILASKTRYE